MVKLVAHRGFTHDYPQNTVKAFRNAAKEADIVELDVRQCGTGELVVFHDGDLEKLTDLSGLVEKTSYDELEGCSVNNSDCGVPQLVDVLDVIPVDVEVMVEVKEEGLVEEVVSVLEGYGNDFLVSSFLPEEVKQFSDYGFRTGFLYTEDEEVLPLDGYHEEIADQFEDPVETAVRLGCEVLHPQHTEVSEAFVEQVHTEGLEVYTWTIRSEETAERVVDAGVDAVISDSLSYVPMLH